MKRDDGGRVEFGCIARGFSPLRDTGVPANACFLLRYYWDPDLDSTSYVHFTSIEPEENRFRFYTITWQKTLWGEWTVRTTWGRIGGDGRSRVTYFDSDQALREALPSVVAHRLERGYEARGVDESTAREPSSTDVSRVHQLVTLGSSVYIDKWTA